MKDNDTVEVGVNFVVPVCYVREFDTILAKAVKRLSKVARLISPTPNEAGQMFITGFPDMATCIKDIHRLQERKAKQEQQEREKNKQLKDEILKQLEDEILAPLPDWKEELKP